MATGNISLTFDTPDIALTGTGEFDISEAFKSLITSNPHIQEEISKKVSQIFRNIPAQAVAVEWVEKIKKSFNLESMVIDLSKDVEKKSKELIKNMSFGQLDIAGVQSNLTKPKVKKDENIKKPVSTMENEFQSFFKNLSGNFDQFFLKMDKQSGKFFTTLTTSNNKFLKTLTTNLTVSPTQPKDSVFDSSNVVTIGDFTDKALDRLSSLFEHIGILQKKKQGQADDVEEGADNKKGWMRKMLDKLLPALGLGSLGRLAGLTGPALLAGGLLWMAWDGIQGWLLREKWGVSGIAAALGGAFGGTGAGAKNAYMNAAKGGLVGGGIGMMVGGPLGLVAGALIGAAVFGIMGYIGGERLAKELDEVGKKLSKWYEEDLKPTVDGWKIWAKETFLPQVTQLWGSLKELGPALALMTKWTVQFVGTVGKFVLSETVKNLNKLAVDIKALGEWLGVTAEKLSNADFWRKKVDDSLDGLKKSVWNFGDWLDDMSDIVNETVGSQKRSPLKSFDELNKEYSQAEQNKDQRAMNHVQRQLDQLKKQMNDQTALLVTPLQELEEQLVKQNKLLFPDPLRIIALERKIEEKKKLEQELGSADTFKAMRKNIFDDLEPIPKIPTKFNWFPNNKEPIRFQSAKDDKEYRMDSGTLNIQPDDILGKTFASIDKQFKALNTLTQKSMDKLDEHAEIFKKLLQVNQQQLNVLPALIPQPAVNSPSFPSTTYDGISDARHEARRQIWG